MGSLKKTQKYLSSKTFQRSACKFLVDGEIQVIRVQAGWHSNKEKHWSLIHFLAPPITKKWHIVALTNESASQRDIDYTEITKSDLNLIRSHTDFTTESLRKMWLIVNDKIH